MLPVMWDRLLETCVRRQATDLLLVPGAPPMVRLHDDWRTLQTVTLDAGAVQALANERFNTSPDGNGDGYAYWDFEHGEGVRFRLMAFGHPQTTLLLVARRPNGGDDPQSSAVPR